MNFILKIIVKSMVFLHKGTIIAKLKSSIILGVLISPITFWNKIQIWFNDHYTFFTIIFLAIILDMALGVYVHVKVYHDFKLKILVAGFLSKLFLTFAGLAIYELINAMFIYHGAEINIYIQLTVYLVVLIFPLGSAIGNLSIATNGVFPPEKWLLTKDKFQKSGNLKDIIKKN